MSVSSEEQLKERAVWLATARRRYQPDYSLLRLSTHGLLLQRDLEAAFIGGAWAAVIVLAQAVIEATFRDLVTSDYETKAKSLFKGNKRLERIRTLRNELLHPQPQGSQSVIWRIGGADIKENHSLLERDAKRAVEYMLYVVFKQSEA